MGCKTLSLKFIGEPSDTSKHEVHPKEYTNFGLYLTENVEHHH